VNQDTTTYQIIRALGGDVNGKIRDVLGIDGGLFRDMEKVVQFEAFLRRLHDHGGEYPELEDRARKLVYAEEIQENIHGMSTDLTKLAVMYGHSTDRAHDVQELIRGLLDMEERL